jgi:hypothetical protein
MRGRLAGLIASSVPSPGRLQRWRFAMRLAIACLLLSATAALCGVALSDPAHTDPKPWHVNTSRMRTQYPESEPNDSCPGQCISCGDVVTPAYLNAGEEDWYRFFASEGEQLTVGTDGVNDGDNTDTYIELYFECGDTSLIEDDDGGPGLYSLIINFPAPHTGYYDLKVRGYSGTSSGPYKFYRTCMPPPPPDNDLCSGAHPIDRCTIGSLQGDTYAAHNDYDPGADGCADGYAEAGNDIAYVLDLVNGDIVDLVYRQLEADAAFYIVTDCGDVAGSCVIGADVTLTGDAETIHWVVSGTGTYYLILDSYGAGSGGTWVLDFNIPCPAQDEGACCLADGSCAVMAEDACNGAGGAYQGDDTGCEPNPCYVVPASSISWGGIRAMYR